MYSIKLGSRSMAQLTTISTRRQEQGFVSLGALRGVLKSGTILLANYSDGANFEIYRSFLAQNL